MFPTLLPSKLGLLLASKLTGPLRETAQPLGVTAYTYVFNLDGIIYQEREKYQNSVALGSDSQSDLKMYFTGPLSRNYMLKLCDLLSCDGTAVCIIYVYH